MLAICIAFSPFTRCLDGVAKAVVAEVKKAVARTVSAKRKEQGRRCEAIKLYNKMIADYAALAVARLMQLEEDGCGMHGDDKIWREAIYDLIRTANKVPVDPFLEGAAVTSRCRDAAKWFSWDQRTRLLGNGCQAAEIPTITPTMDLNGTRVAAIHSLYLSMLRPMKGLMVAWKTPLGITAPNQLDEDDFEMVAEFEAVGNVTRVSTKVMQNEVAWTGAYKSLIHQQVESKLDFSIPNISLSTFDYKAVTNETPQPRMKKEYDDFTLTGQRCWERAHEAAVRRHKLQGAVVKDQDLMNTLLDVRTKHCSHLSHNDFQKAKGL